MKNHRAIVLCVGLLAFGAPALLGAAELGEPAVPSCGGDDEKKKDDGIGSYAPSCQCGGDDGKSDK